MQEIQHSVIDETSKISNESTIGNGVEVGPFSIIYPNVHLENGVKVGSHCEIGMPCDSAMQEKLVIGKNSVIRSHSVLYAGTRIGRDFKSGHFCLIRENTSIGDNCSIGSMTQLQGDCSLGNFTRLHSNVHIAKGSKIGNFVWFFPNVLITNDPNPPSDACEECIVEDYAVICSNVLIMPGIRINQDAFITANSRINLDVPRGKVASGDPAKIICDASILKMKNNLGKKAYPWRYRFKSNYPDSIISQWERELNSVVQNHN